MVKNIIRAGTLTGLALAAATLAVDMAHSQSLEETVLFMMTGISSAPPYKTHFYDKYPAFTEVEYKLNIEDKCKFSLEINSMRHYSEKKWPNGRIEPGYTSPKRMTFDIDMSKIAEITYAMKPHQWDELTASLDKTLSPRAPSINVRSVPTMTASGAKDAICTTSYDKTPPSRGCSDQREWQFYYSVPNLSRFERAYQHYTKNFCPPRSF